MDYPFASGGIGSLVNGSRTLAFEPPLAGNQRYTLKVVANYTYETRVVSKKGTTYQNLTESASKSRSFIYQEDTSLDGLTNAEKEAGWTIPLAPTATPEGRVSVACTPAANATASQKAALAAACATDPSALVTATPDEYATNGLVSDYVEKEYDLNPNTIDTAGSHMLDTWNLTFDLGSASSQTTTAMFSGGALNLSKYFHFYYENATYNFSQSCQQFRASAGACAFTPPSTPLSNLTCLSEGSACVKGTHPWVGDSTPWASNVLWSSSALSSFENLLKYDRVGWLRAVTGQYKAQRTMTVWGKLSWGANPLSNSTSYDGLADGDQPDPLGPMVLELNLTFWQSDGPWAGADGGGDQVEPWIQIRTTPNATGTLLYQGYGPPNESYNLGQAWLWQGAYLVSAPIVTANQVVYWQIEMVANTSSGLESATGFNGGSVVYPWEATDLVGGGATVARTVDLNLTYPYGNDGNRTGEYSINTTVAPDPRKANTLLVVPANETTLSGTPWGLRRYTGEPDFDLLVLNLVNVSGPVTLHGIGSAEGTGSYNVTLMPGLNNVLVPRGVFITSPLGQALLNNTNVTFPYTAGLTFTGWYWASRSQEESGMGPGNPDFIRVFAPSNESEAGAGANQSAYGGIPGAPSIEVGNESRQVQAVVWANVSATAPYDELGGVSELGDLLGGLVLNSTGNASYDVLNVTKSLWTLGLPANVLSVLANYTIPNDGSYPNPVFHPPPPPGPNQFFQFLQEIWNTASGVAAVCTMTIGGSPCSSGGGLWRFFSVVWSVFIASQAYIDGAVAGGMAALSRGLEEVSNQAVRGLRAVERVMEWALDAIVDNIFEPLLQPLINTDTAYTQALGDDLPAGNPIQFWDDYAGVFFLSIAGFAGAATLAFAIMDGLCLGATLVASLIVTLIVSGASIYGNSHQSAFVGLSPYSPSIVTQLASILPSSSQQLDVDLRDLATMLSALTTTWAVQDVESATIPTPFWSSAWGTALGIVALLTASVAGYFGSFADAVVSLSFDAASVIVDFLDWKFNPEADGTQDAVTAALDVAAGGLDLKVFGWPGAW